MNTVRLSERCLCSFLVIALLMQGCANPAPVGSELRVESASLSEQLPPDAPAALVFGRLTVAEEGEPKFPVPSSEPIDPATGVAMAGLCVLLIAMFVASSLALGAPAGDPGCIPSVAPPEPPRASIVAWEVASERWARIRVQEDGSFAVRLPEGRYAILGWSQDIPWLEFLFTVKPGDRARYLGTLEVDYDAGWNIENKLQVRDELNALLTDAGEAGQKLKAILHDPSPAAWVPGLLHTSYGLMRAKGTSGTPHEMTFWKFPAPSKRPSPGYRDALLKAFEER